MAGVPIEQVRRCYDAREVREFDRVAIVDRGVPGIVLMKRAGAALWRCLRARYAPATLDVFCGKGNNAGDGYVVARLAADAGVGVRVVEVSPQPSAAGDAGTARAWAQAGNVQFVRFDNQLQVAADVVVDALLGTGLAGDVRAPYADAIGCINTGSAPVVAADLPSGLSADTGAVLGSAVLADMTVSFIALKRGLLTGAGPQVCGTLYLDDLDVPAGVVDHTAGVEVLRLGATVDRPARRARDAHKNRFGHVLIIGGDDGMGGAVLLAAEAALRSGAGLVSVATRERHVQPLLARCPSAMVAVVRTARDLPALLERADCVVAGPGLGTGAWGTQLLQHVLDAGKPLVLDADALTLLARAAVTLPADHRGCLLTPHPGEAARLLGQDNTSITRDRFGAARAIAQQYRATVILKGAGSLVMTVPGPPATQPRCGIVVHGNPGMATAGMGDVLAGVCGALLAQDSVGSEGDLHVCAARAACVHAAAGDLAAAEHGEIGLNAHDMPGAVRAILNGAGAHGAGA